MAEIRTIGRNSFDIQKTACFTGHRPENLPNAFRERPYLYGKLKDELNQLTFTAILEGYDTFLCGMAKGVDLMAAKEVIRLQRDFPYIRLIGVSPFEREIKSRHGDDLEDYLFVRDHCHSMIYINDYYNPNCYRQRNDFMVDCSSLVIGVVCKTTGGTANTLKYARGAKREIQLVDLDGIVSGRI